MRLMKSTRLGVAFVLICGLGGFARAAGVIVPGGTFDVTITNDPNGDTVTNTNIPLSSSPTIIDNALMNVSEIIEPVNATTAWIQFTFHTANNQPLAGDPSATWEIQISNIQTTGPSALLQYYTTFTGIGAAAGAASPFPFPGTSSATNPILGQPSPVSLELFDPPYTYVTPQSLYAYISPFNQPPTNFGNGTTAPVEFIEGGEYLLSPVPEPASVVLLGLGGMGLLGHGWRRRRKATA